MTFFLGHALDGVVADVEFDVLGFQADDLTFEFVVAFGFFQITSLCHGISNSPLKTPMQTNFTDTQLRDCALCKSYPFKCA